MRPSVLILVVDSLRADRVLGGDRACRTPNLDDFRRAATSFTRAFSVASTTTPCTTSILTGTYPFAHGVHSLAGRRLGPDLPTLAERFKAAGFHTWAETTGPLEAVTGLDRGFDEYRCRDYRQWLDTPFGDELLARLRADGGPWFGYVHLWEVHYPRRVTRGYNRAAYGRTLYDRAVSSLDAQLGRVLDAVPDDTVVVVTGDHGEYLSPSRKNELVTRLKGPTAWLKQHVPVVRKLRRRMMPLLFKGMRPGTPTSTEGYRAWLGHGFHVYEPLVHVPLLVRGPDRFPAGLEVSSMASHVDLFSTLASALELDGEGAAQPGSVDLAQAARGGEGAGRSEVYLQASGARRMNRPEQWLAAIRTERHKYVRGLYSEELPQELYDLESDPGETENLAAARPDLAAELEGRLVALMASAAPEGAVAGTAYTPEEEQLLEERLRELGYLD
ncbi:MAG: sulfatase family protein [Gaiellaceae bacterium]